MSLTGIKTRSHVVQSVRQSLLSRGYEEYIPQLMMSNQPIEPTIYPFATQWDRNQQTSTLYLSTSPESYLKQILATGEVENCFSISHAFRNLEGEGNHHSPEFLMAEWYRQDASWIDIMNETQGVVSEILSIPETKPWPKVSLVKMWNEYEKIDLSTLMTDESMIDFSRQKGYQTENATWEQLLYQHVFNDIEPHYSKNPFFLVDFPKRVSPLAKPQPNNPDFAERFELLIDGVELANGNTENTDTESMGDTIDQTLQHSLDQMKSHSWAGVGLGLDRLAIMMGHHDNIKEVQWP